METTVCPRIRNRVRQTFQSEKPWLAFDGVTVECGLMLKKSIEEWPLPSVFMEAAGRE